MSFADFDTFSSSSLTLETLGSRGPSVVVDRIDEGAVRCLVVLDLGGVSYPRLPLVIE